jgi:hypothetical protein
MLDLETLSTRPNAAIIQIGMVAFDRKTFEIIERGICLNVSPELTKYHTDMNTVRFWSGQPDHIRQSVFDNFIYMDDALREVDDYYHSFCDSEEPSPIWANPPSFDLVIIENAFHTEGLEIPWHYRVPRDMRTLVDLAGLGKEDLVKAEAEHNAYSDCLAQIKTLKKCFERLSL